MNNKESIIKEIKKTKWYDMLGKDFGIETYSLQGLKEFLISSKNWDIYYSKRKAKKCPCGKIINEKHNFCEDCYKKYKQRKFQKARLKRLTNLDTSLALNLPNEVSHLKVKKKKKLVDDKVEKKRMFNLYFSNNFKNYTNFCSFIRTFKLDWRNKMDIELKLSELDVVEQNLIKKFGNKYKGV